MLERAGNYLTQALRGDLLCSYLETVSMAAPSVEVLAGRYPHETIPYFTA